MPLAPFLAEGAPLAWGRDHLAARALSVLQHGEGSVDDLVEAMFGTLERRVGRLPFG
jgi:hypothetical protein